jgi:integrase
MPKKSRYPKLRVHVKRGRSGQRWTSWWYDMRGTGQPDIALGTDYAEALRRWDELHNQRARVAGTLEEAFKDWETKALPGYENRHTREGYTKSLRALRPVFGPAGWDQVTLPMLVQYLKARSAKTRAKHELRLLSLVWNWARMEGLTDIAYPAHGMQRTGWMGPSKAREVEVTDDAFGAIYAHADQLLRDAMDIATSTGLRVTDVLQLRLSDVRGGKLVVSASKTAKRIEFDLSASAVLPALIERRKADKRPQHLFLLAWGVKVITYRMLAARFAKAREEAAKTVPEAAGLILRDMRKRAAQLAPDLAGAADLLQHDDRALTRKHYRPGQTVKPVR